MAACISAGEAGDCRKAAVHRQARGRQPADAMEIFRLAEEKRAVPAFVTLR